MDAIDECTLAASVLAIDDKTKLKVQALLGEEWSGDAPVWRYLNFSMKSGIVRAYLAARYGDAAKYDWFSVYAKLCQARDNLIVGALKDRAEGTDASVYAAVASIAIAKTREMRERMLSDPPGTAYPP